jgi:glycine/D-amino acid oxidase-like deaminating enzyme
VVAGGGVFGAAAALELASRGWEVTLLDPHPLPYEGASSTDVSRMIRMDYGSDVFYHELAERALDGWDRWNADWPRPLYHQDGFLILSKGPMAPGGFEHESWRVLRERGHAPERMSPGVLAERFPAWRGGAYSDGYFNPRAGWAESGGVVDRLLALCEARGVSRRAAGLADLLDSGSAARGVRTTSGERLAADRVVVCAGAWTPSLLPPLADRLRSVAQPVLYFGVDDPALFRGDRFPPWAADIAGSGWYGFPALPDGRLKIGHHGIGAEAHPDARGDVGTEHVASARAFLRQAIPALADAPLVSRRVCMYCDTFDGDFLIDRDPEREGLVVATGGSGHAFKFAPILGSLIADAVEGVANRWGSRFRWRAGGVKRTEGARFSPEEARFSPAVDA